jgi:predicted  nucleic acid-binding Zn-ribbon protein
MTRGDDLQSLQRLDSDSDERRRRLVEVEDALGKDEEVRQARQALDHAQSWVQRCTVQQQDLELELGGLTEKTARSEQRLYGGTVKNPKVLADQQAEIASLRKRRQKLEDDLLAAMIERDEAQEALAQAKERATGTEARWSDLQADLTAERDALSEWLARAGQERTAVLARIDPSDVAAYESLRRRKRGLAVAVVRGGSCSACGVTVSAGLKWQLREGKRGHCSNCERIILLV